jgi:Trypsin-like peptidase domain
VGDFIVVHGGSIWARLPGLLYAAVFLFLQIAVLRAAECVDPKALVSAVVSVERRFSEEERRAGLALLGVRGTAWFLTPELMVAAEHVSASMGLSDQNWQEVEIMGKDSFPELVRVQRLAGAGPEKLAVLILRSAFAAAQPLRIRGEPLREGEPLVSLGFPLHQLRFASGRFVRYSEVDGFSGRMLLELYDGNDRLALDHGASGAPVLDCEGKVAAVVSNIFAKTMPLMTQTIRVSTAWGNPNIAAIPISVLAAGPAWK